MRGSGHKLELRKLHQIMRKNFFPVRDTEQGNGEVEGSL